MQILRTPDERFEGLADYPFAPHYTTIQTHDGTDLRIHHLDEGPIEGSCRVVYARPAGLELFVSARHSPSDRCGHARDRS